MADFLKGSAALLLAFALSFAAAYVTQDWLGRWIQASEEWAVMQPFLGAWAIAVASVLGIVRCLTRTVIALDRAAAALTSLVIAGALATIAMQFYVDASMIDRRMFACLASIAALMLLTVAIQWGILCLHRARRQERPAAQ